MPRSTVLRDNELRRERTPSGEVLSYRFAWEEHGAPHASQHLHMLDLAVGLIVSDKVFCGGRWPADLMAEMEAAGA